jgi:ribosomal protein S18 acetylase RimI-like enzyme
MKIDFTPLAENAEPTIELYTSREELSKNYIDQLCKLISMLDRTQNELEHKLGIQGNFESTPEEVRNSYFGTNDLGYKPVFALLVAKDELCGYAFEQVMAKNICISMLYVLPKYQGKGHGRKLMEQLLTYNAEHYSKCSVYLGVYANNAAAIKLYKSLGFTIPMYYNLLLKK